MMMRIRDGTPLRNNDITRLAKAVTTVTDNAMTIAGFSCTVTANAEQIPRICTMTGLFAENGPVRYLKFLAFILIHFHH